nr:MAG TPA: peptidase [Microviridae sp.]
MNPELMKFIEWLFCRNIHFAVNSALRTVAQNDACNGSKNSQHLTGDAIDLAPIDFPIGAFCSIVENSPFEFDQLIRYRTFIHVSFARGRKPRQMKLDFTDRK